MTDPLRRDPREFLRLLRRMGQNSSWHKAMLFASKGRMIGYPMGLDHYNAILFSQSLWGRALEITQVIRAMKEDDVQPNGVSYYYICNGMGNADHGYNQGYNLNHKLKGLQHWRLAIEALTACEHNGYDATDTMYNSTVVACCTPTIDKWTVALGILNRMVANDRRPHPQMVTFLEKCLMRHQRPRDTSALLRYAADNKVKGYEHRWEPDIYRHLPDYTEDSPGVSVAGAGDAEEAMAVERERAVLEPFSGGLHSDEKQVFRPRVYRQLWYKWHEVANRYRPTSVLRKKQLAPKHSPCGIPGFFRL
jgi:hypothetical protein